MAFSKLSAPPSSAERPSCGAVAVSVVKAGDGRYRIRRGDAAYLVRGAGGSRELPLLRELGGTTIRTWHIGELEQEVDGVSLPDRCQALGLTVMAGIWVAHERHGFNYDDPERVERQRAEVRAAVRRWRDHPAILMWGLGNEMEGPEADGRDARIWRELEVLARIVKEEDAHHPVCTVIAGASELKVRTLQAHYTSFDVLGVNAYGSAGMVAPALRAAGYDGPFILAEFGPVGHWEVEQTPWGAPIEPSGVAKMERYLDTYARVTGDVAGRCVGTMCFVWGHKQETTATWYGMFLPSGERTPAVDAMARAWTGEWPAGRSPLIKAMEVPFAGARVVAGTRQEVRAEIEGHGAAAVRLHWLVVGESTDRKSGGDPEKAPPEFPECVVASEGWRATLVLPSAPGAYRLFLYVRNARGGGTADNVPFYVEAD